MPTLFISYKRGTAAVAPLMEKLREAHYRLWFDRDEIHLGDPDWQAPIDQGIERCDGVILNITPDACQSEPVQYEVRKARELGKPIFPIILERIKDYSAAIRDLGLAEKQHVEDFTDVTRWDEQIQRLLRDLEAQGLRVTRHDRRQQRDRNNPNYVLHQRYLKRLVEQIGTLNLAQINPDNAQGVELERVYIDSPTALSLSVELQDWQIVNWGIRSTSEKHPLWKWDLPRKQLQVILEAKENQDRAYAWAEGFYSPADLGLETAPFETLIGQVDQQIAEYRVAYPNVKPDDEPRWLNLWNNGTHNDVLRLHLNHLAAARDRLVILGAPGSGKSTFVKFLALCLAGAGIDDWRRDVNITTLDNWPHGALTPVYVELRRFVASKHFPVNAKSPVSADDLWAYLEHEMLGDELRPYADDLRYDLEHGYAVLILDGLDEVPYPESKLKQRQQQLISLAQSLNTRYTGSRIIVASRPYAYDGWALPGFQAVTITEFENKHRIELASRLYRAAEQKAASEKAQSLNEQLAQIDPQLKDRPLFVTLMATIYLKREGLPTRRGELYRDSILLLVDRWTQGKVGAPSLTAVLGNQSLDELYARLAALAYDVHEHFGEQPGTPEIEYEILFRHLKPLGKHVAVNLISYLSENAGVLVSPGQDVEKDVFHFAHRTFQEYLAAVHLVTLCTEADSFDLIRELIMSKPQMWRVPCVLAGDVLADTDRRGDLWGLIGTLLEDDPPISGDDPSWWLVWLAATVSIEQKLHEQEKLNRRTEQPIRDILIDWLVALIQTPQALPPVERALCGRFLSQLGDPRTGVGLRADGLPDIDWIPIPEGKFQYGHEAEGNNPPQTLWLPSYGISRYPITNAQFAAFVNDPEGYYDPAGRWFAELKVDEDDKQLKKYFFTFRNYPQGNINWYQAVAFCRWLSWRLGGSYDLNEMELWLVRLPTELEWEKAARGHDARVYPYEGEFDNTKVNTKETGIGEPSTVGIFPNGASPYGVLDMSGNVLEWSITNYAKPAPQADNENLNTEIEWVLRGGSYFIDANYARATFRFRLFSHRVAPMIGFRIACHPSLLKS